MAPAEYGVVTSTEPAVEFVEWWGATTGRAGVGAVVVTLVAAGTFCDAEAEGGKGERGVRGVTASNIGYAGVAGRAGSGSSWSASLVSPLPESMA